MTAFARSGTSWLAACVAVVAAIISTTAGGAEPHYVASAKPGDCVACHKTERVLPAKHKSTKDMDLNSCHKCHQPKTESSLAGKMPDSHTHHLAKVECSSCHGNDAKPQAASRAQCVTCHEAQKLIEKTANVKPENPHTSPHWGTEMECSACHVQHSDPVNYCAYCHNYDFKMP